ncbi:hypothetical protein [Flavobacterium pectinovorum]|uniref:DUF1735 domain-containing protein n=1 Tax=Flavobacterium pectinovorum TaxID=29533 RepID=A0AB36NZQ2_9FLAO|nr:hypothetical protein [Flavobacterium pectinovorum]OXB00925.1 hypothetical protein B0A72_19375 [Flavobacterium pectinovorum]SHN18247.1 hypothetical protein SAMN05444387_4506 [Flavobacterium pectinovorum]
MNHIKIIAVSIVLTLFASCSKDDYKLDSKNIDPFIRFNFQTTSTGIPLEYPAINTSLVPASTYDNKSVKTLKIPVTLTSTNLKNAVEASFSVTTTGSEDDFTLNPVDKLLFEGTKLTDTLFLSFDKRWQPNQSITLKLQETSDPAIHIGNLNTSAVNDVFTVNLGEISTTYTFPVNRINIKGVAGETVDFKINFPNGFLPSEIENLDTFTFLNGFEYSLTHDDFGDDRSSITYHLTLLEDIQNDDVRYVTDITLNNTTNYTATGNTILQIIKPIKSPRDVQANPASKFYDLSNQFYLTYGEHWFDKSGTCAWQTFNAFTFPLVVTKDNENAILYSDKGTTNTADDVYHDAFIIGFNVVTGTNTTNSFGLKRFFSNESTAAQYSPGFNITSALEFFPTNGNSKTDGKVLVIPQYITIGTTKVSHVIAIAGEGTYKEISTGLFEISFELKLTNDELFGGTVSTQYKMYNNKTYPKIDPINDACPKEVTL